MAGRRVLIETLCPRRYPLPPFFEDFAEEISRIKVFLFLRKIGRMPEILTFWGTGHHLRNNKKKFRSKIYK